MTYRPLRLLAAAALIGTAAAQSAPTPPAPLVQAHRGYSELYPENTLPAFERAIEAGADRLETDLWFSADGTSILLHDRSVDRTTDGSGVADYLSLEELRALDAGAWKASQHAGTRIPTLEELLGAVAGRAEINLEIKTSSRPKAAWRRSVDLALEVLSRSPHRDRVLFSSFDLEALLYVRQKAPEYRLILIDWEQQGSFGGLQMAAAARLYAWSPKNEYLTEDQVREAHAAGLKVFVGAAPNARLLELRRWGVDGFSGDDPRALVEFLRQEGLR
ncbi:glycerophosphoryl diester phosphodiesterase [Deinobacterium chartae]|uniref:Glycerophosphoryl diester phosphodiesterase n=1 Tax=Deinobacterium chartae TaxID=521158 RepID=A0A841HYI2_9DEIO|nr:glycerophosphodiester phosphodiesterase family protein [Deinobacterium chartae]MBB6097279.1 glycerophosphoryl diester phosphodiesterase [Deinobacterium chartae]